MEKIEIERMIKGKDTGLIIKGLMDKGALIRANAAIRAAQLNVKEKDVIMNLTRLEKDNEVLGTSLYGITVSDIAAAALDILGEKKYTGNNEIVKKFIETKFEL